jgi:hypothetical protein
MLGLIVRLPPVSKPSSLIPCVCAGVPKLRSVGRSVILEDDDDEQDFATSAQRLLKLVDQDFADVAGVFYYLMRTVRSVWPLPCGILCCGILCTQ